MDARLLQLKTPFCFCFLSIVGRILILSKSRMCLLLKFLICRYLKKSKERRLYFCLIWVNKPKTLLIYRSRKVTRPLCFHWVKTLCCRPGRNAWLSRIWLFKYTSGTLNYDLICFHILSELRMTVFPLYKVGSILEGLLSNALRNVPLHKARSNLIHCGISLSFSKSISLHQAILRRLAAQ